MTPRAWVEGGTYNDGDVIFRLVEEDGRLKHKIVTADGEPIASYPVVSDIRSGGGHLEYFFERQVKPGPGVVGATPFDYDDTHRTAAIHY